MMNDFAGVAGVLVVTCPNGTARGALPTGVQRSDQNLASNHSLVFGLLASGDAAANDSDAMDV